MSKLSKEAIESAVRIRSQIPSDGGVLFHPEWAAEKLATIIDASFEPLRKSHAELIVALDNLQAAAMNAMGIESTSVPPMNAIGEMIQAARDAVKSAQSLNN